MCVPLNIKHLHLSYEKNKLYQATHIHFFHISIDYESSWLMVSIMIWKIIDLNYIFLTGDLSIHIEQIFTQNFQVLNQSVSGIVTELTT